MLWFNLIEIQISFLYFIWPLLDHAVNEYYEYRLNSSADKVANYEILVLDILATVKVSSSYHKNNIHVYSTSRFHSRKFQRK